MKNKIFKIGKYNIYNLQDINNVQSDIHSPSPVRNVTDDEEVIITDEELKEDDRKEDTNKPRDITPWNVID